MQYLLLLLLVILGHYRSSNLLHFSLRHKLHWTSDWLSNPANVPASKWFASPNIRGQTPMDVAKNVGFLRHAESMEQYMVYIYIYDL